MAQRLQGTVSSLSGINSITVKVETLTPHPLYTKRVKVRSPCANTQQSSADWGAPGSRRRQFLDPSRASHRDREGETSSEGGYAAVCSGRPDERIGGGGGSFPLLSPARRPPLCSDIPPPPHPPPPHPNRRPPSPTRCTTPRARPASGTSWRWSPASPSPRRSASCSVRSSARPSKGRSISGVNRGALSAGEWG